MKRVLSGIDRLARGHVSLPDQRYGLVTASSARTEEGLSSRALLHERYQITWLFSPEHGLDGTAKEGEDVASGRDRLTGLPVFSLYQQGLLAPAKAASAQAGAEAATARKALVPDEIVEEIDCFLYDLPDLGVRYYTYISTLLQVIELCAEKGKGLIILDRPCPLGGEVLEGLPLVPSDFSFVGAYSLPVRYGLTAGELAILYGREKGLALDLQVIEVQGWTRSEMIFDTGRVFDIPSPNMPNRESALLYPGTCLIEGTNLSEGRGTSRPFSWFGAPWIDHENLCRELRKLDHQGLALRPVGFTPSASKYQGETCYGIALEITDPSVVRALAFMIETLGVLKALYPEELEFPTFPGAEQPFMARLLGKALTEGEWPIWDFREQEARETKTFRARTQGNLLYR